MSLIRLILVFIFAVSMANCSKKASAPSASLPPKGKAIAPFELTNQDGQPATLGTYAGNVWVANFVFTTCPSICPEVTKAVAELQKTLDEKELKAKLVTLTVDPEVDTPEILRDYGLKYGAKFERWSFLTASSVDVMRAVVEGNFKTAMGEKKAIKAGMYDIAHTTKLVLVDQDGHHRGYYSMDSSGRQHLVKAIQALTDSE